MNNNQSEAGTADFFQIVRAWLSAFPWEIQEISDDSNQTILLNIEAEKGRRLDLFLNKTTGKPQNQLIGFERGATRRVVVWEDQWITKPNIVKSRLLAQLGRSHRIPARLTNVHRLDRPTTLRFLQENHLQSPTLAKYSYGLYLPPQYFRVLPFPVEFTASSDQENGLLVAIATFARPRNFSRDHGIHRSFELVRFASLRYHTVVGGLDKLLKYFTRTHAPDDLMTYADLEWSDGQGYQKLGFEAQGDTLPHDFWVDPQTMIRYEPKRLPGGIDADHAVQMGFIGVKNAGSRKFVKLIHP